MIRTPNHTKGQRYAHVEECECGGKMRFQKNYDPRDEDPLPDAFVCIECEHEVIAEIETIGEDQ